MEGKPCACLLLLVTEETWYRSGSFAIKQPQDEIATPSARNDNEELHCCVVAQ